jgi:heat shock protein beta
MDRVLRRSLGVSEEAQADDTVKPAPPVDPELPSEEEEVQPITVQEDFDGKPGVILPDDLKDKIELTMEEIDDDGNPVVQHDEL